MRAMPMEAGPARTQGGMEMYEDWATGHSPRAAEWTGEPGVGKGPAGPGPGADQKDLVAEITEKPQVVVDYESGQAGPNNQTQARLREPSASSSAGRTRDAEEKGPRAKWTQSLEVCATSRSPWERRGVPACDHHARVGLSTAPAEHGSALPEPLLPNSRQTKPCGGFASADGFSSLTSSWGEKHHCPRL